MYNESDIYFIYSSFFLYCLCMHSRTPLNNNNNTLDDIGKQTHIDNVALVFKTINAIDTGNWLCYIEGTDAKRSFRMVVNGKLQSLFFIVLVHLSIFIKCVQLVTLKPFLLCIRIQTFFFNIIYCFNENL